MANSDLPAVGLFLTLLKRPSEGCKRLGTYSRVAKGAPVAQGFGSGLTRRVTKIAIVCRD